MFCPDIAEAGSVIDETEQSNLSTNSNEGSFATIQLSDSEDIGDFLEVGRLLDTLKSTNASINASVTEEASQNTHNSNFLLSDTTLMTAMPEVQTAYMQYQSKFQKISATAQSEQFSNYIDLLKALADVQVSQSQLQSSDLSEPTDDHHQNRQQIPSQPQFQFESPSSSIGCNLNNDQLLALMQLLAIQSALAGFCMSYPFTMLCNPFATVGLQISMFSDLQKQLSDSMTQRNNDSNSGNSGAQYPNYLQVAEILSSFNNTLSTQQGYFYFIVSEISDRILSKFCC